MALEAFDQSVVLSLVKHERRPCGVREAHDMPDEDEMIARVLMALGAALQVRSAAGDQRYPTCAGRMFDAFEPVGDR